MSALRGGGGTNDQVGPQFKKRTLTLSKKEKRLRGGKGESAKFSRTRFEGGAEREETSPRRTRKWIGAIRLSRKEGMEGCSCE